ncbi:MAG: hypothetical protein HN366_10805 [Deltaproteobacteria bacterium]|nr:hypothetical protein [Deltaproteobacteria bacterium]
MNLNDDQKVQVVVAELQERYGASHKIRERSTRFAIWLSGLAIGLAWLLISSKELSYSQLFTLRILILALWGVAAVFILGLRKGFNGNHRTMITCERALGMFDSGLYLSNESLLPASYATPRERWCNHFNTLCVWLCIIVLALLVLTWTSPEQSTVDPIKNKIEAMKGERTEWLI